ncbi:MAG: MATE family efflux transporter [Clostridia bacterium]|nr:MATE family efflux transporter [Clostridia bacterium]
MPTLPARRPAAPFYKKYIGDRAFYKLALTVAVPVMLQNLITQFVNMLDNIMVGALGTEQMSGVSIVNQLVLIFNLALFGALSGIGIFTAQYYGKGDNDGIRYTMRYKLYVVIGLAITAIAVFLLFDEPLIRLFLHSAETGADGDLAATLEYGKTYLVMLLWGLVPFGVSQAFADTMRETGDTFTPMAAGFAAVGANCLFNYLLIFGKLFFPAMGVAGAALATVISRFLEAAILLVYAFTHKQKFPYLKKLLRGFKIPKELLKVTTRKGAPLLVNEILWSGGFSALGVAYSLHGLDVVAGYSIATTVTNLFSIAFMALGVSIGIIVGKLLGAEKHDEAYDTARKMIVFSFFVSVTVGLLMFAFGRYIPMLYTKTGDNAKALATYFIRVMGLFLPLHALSNASYFTLRSGGKTLITFLFDSVSLWLTSVPAAFLLFYVGHLSIYWVVPLIQCLELVKDVLGLYLVKKKVWIKTII